MKLVNGNLNYTQETLFLLNTLPGAIAYKDRNSNYLACNQLLASYMGYEKPEDIVGLSDHDIKNEMSELATQFIKQDKQVINDGECQHIDIGRYCDGNLQSHFSVKKPLLNDNNIVIGTVFTCIELQPTALKTIYDDLLKHHGPGFFTLGGHYKQYGLTQRESICLFYLIRGYTAKETATKLFLSRKTVEYYIEQLKNKLDCCNKAELIEKSIHLGFVLSIPSSILGNFPG